MMSKWTVAASSVTTARVAPNSMSIHGRKLDEMIPSDRGEAGAGARAGAGAGAGAGTGCATRGIAGGAAGSAISSSIRTRPA
jgi:hypothetical protein